ncbi:hypothetical protein BGX26_002771 [Mortierella sp. AD094]|nr:hypothetical protein BGX26_002771 [Mortierella sp. AD094]
MPSKLTLPSPIRSAHSPQTLLEVARSQLENARNTTDNEVALAFCDEVKASVNRIKRAMKGPRAFESPEGQYVRDQIVTIFRERADVLEKLGHRDRAQASIKKAEKWEKLQTVQERRNSTQRFSKLIAYGQIFKSRDSSSRDNSSADLVDLNALANGDVQPQPQRDIIEIPPEIFPMDTPKIMPTYVLPEPDGHFTSIRQLVHCIQLLPTDPTTAEEFFLRLDEPERTWARETAENQEERARLQHMVEALVSAFITDELKKQETVAEVVSLGPVLGKDLYRTLLMSFIDTIKASVLLHVHLVEGLAKLIKFAAPGYLCQDDLIKILTELGIRLKGTHAQSTEKIYGLTLAMSHVLDAMADSQVKDLSREVLHVPLSGYLNELKRSPDPYLVFQAAYAYQALQYIPDDETPWQAAARRTGTVVRGISGVVRAVKGFDLCGFIDGLQHLQDSAVEVFGVLKLGLDPAFQWGVCLRMGDLAVNPHWCEVTRRSSLALMDEMYRNDAAWGQQARVKQWILHIFSNLRTMLEDKIAEVALTFHREMGNNGDEAKQILYRQATEMPAVKSPIKTIYFQPPKSSTLLGRVQNKPDVEADLRRLGRQRVKERGKPVYIPPQCKANLKAHLPDKTSLMDKVQIFLKSEQEVFLLLGDSGAGKSAFCSALECMLWKDYNKDAPIPLLINLPAIDKPENDLIAKHLRRSLFSEPQIKEMKENREFILICDGYDESQLVHNLYVSNRLNREGEWQVKMVVACRSEYLGNDYKDQFQPITQNHQSRPAHFQEAVIAPFTTDQIHEYIKEYVITTKSIWLVDDYKDVFEKIPHLLDLVKNPFLLTLSLDSLPRLVDPQKTDFSSTNITRVALYDQFLELWLERGKRSLAKKELSSQEKKALESLTEEGFAQNGITFLKNLASAIYREQDGNPVVEYSRIRDRLTWKAEFFGQEDEKQLLRKASPITRYGNQFQFIHKSILEYCVTRAVFEPQKGEKLEVIAPTKVRRGSVSSVLSFESLAAPEEVAASAIEQPILDSPLAQKNLVGEASVLEFLVERVQQEPLFKQQLFAIIERSKSEKEDIRKVRKAAANAITILVKAGVQFNGVDLNGVQIPGADLSHGAFDYAQFQNADLRKVDFRNIWLRHADLEGSKMAGVKFGELPFLTENHGISCCTSSPDGTICAVGLDNGTISLYNTLTWERTKTWSGHIQGITSLAFSPNGERLISSNGKTVRAWDVQTEERLHVFKDHTDDISSIAYSPNGDQIATASKDSTVRIWDLGTGECKNVLQGHLGYIKTIAYSPDGKLLASGGRDKKILVWDLESGTRFLKLEKHRDLINDIVFSPKGDRIASCSRDATASLWNFKTGDSLSLKGHNDHVKTVAYSPNGNQVATGSVDLTVRLWETERGECIRVLEGHTDWIKCIAYSPKGDRIVSASFDKTLRLWDTDTGISQTLNGHTDTVSCVMYLPNGKQIASGGKDRTIRLWDAESGVAHHTPIGHTQAVDSVVYSPVGNFVATGSKDKSVRIWDAETGICLHRLTHKPDRKFECIPEDFIADVIYSPDGKQLASKGIDQTVRLWNTETGLLQHTIGNLGDPIDCVVYSPDNSILATGSNDNKVRLWDVQTGKCVQTLDEHENDITCIVFTAKGDQLASATKDGTVSIWDIKTGALQDVLMYHDDSINSIAYSPNGKQLASASDDKTVRVCSIEAGHCMHTLRTHKDAVTNVIYSPQGNQFASTGKDKIVILWSSETGLLERVLRGHSRSIITTMYSPKGDMIATSSSDNTVQLWDSKNGNRLTIIEGFRNKVPCVSWNQAPNGYYLATASHDRSVRQWEIIKGVDPKGRDSKGGDPKGGDSKGGEPTKAVLRWSTVQEELTMSKVHIKDVQGLSQVNLLLLEQRGSVGVPTMLKRSPSKSSREAETKSRSLSNPTTLEASAPMKFIRSFKSKTLPNIFEQSAS